MKKMIFLLVDSLIPDVLEQGLAARTLPALQFLRERGQFKSDVVTVFPTMTASVDSSLLTGHYPDVHKVPGLIWFDPSEKKVINYINGLLPVWKEGVKSCAHNVLLHLNEKHLSRGVSTLFEELSNRGKTSASINMIIHRGPVKHRLKLSAPFSWVTGISKKREVSGPDYLTIGSLAYPSFFSSRQPKGGPWHLYGINDHYAVGAAKQLIETGNQPDFMMLYLPDNDHKVHKKNPQHAETALIQVDHMIQTLLNAFDSWEQAIENNIFFITSDHGQTRIGRESCYNIDLDGLLAGLNILPPGCRAGLNTEAAVCNNERMAYFYPMKPGIEQRLIGALAAEPRIDVIAWKEDGGVTAIEGGSGKRMHFRPGGTIRDAYGRAWQLAGDLTVLDIRAEESMISYRDYPDALSRLYGALYSQDCPLLVGTARPRFEFKTKYYPTHLNGGSHGSLHKWDSLIPLIVAGADNRSPLPPRIVDMKDYILSFNENDR